MAAKVYFTDMRAGHNKSLLDKLEMLFDRAGLPEIVQDGDLVALKLHFGEKGCTAFIRPQFLRRIVNRVKSLGGRGDIPDKFRALCPKTDWSRQLVYAEKIGLGSRQYELISV